MVNLFFGKEFVLSFVQKSPTFADWKVKFCYLFDAWDFSQGVDLIEHASGAPAGIWPVVRTYDAEEWGGGVI